MLSVQILSISPTHHLIDRPGQSRQCPLSSIGQADDNQEQTTTMILQTTKSGETTTPMATVSKASEQLSQTATRDVHHPVRYRADAVFHGDLHELMRKSLETQNPVDRQSCSQFLGSTSNDFVSASQQSPYSAVRIIKKSAANRTNSEMVGYSALGRPTPKKRSGTCGVESRFLANQSRTKSTGSAFLPDRVVTGG
jgi:hypothetical protein